MQKFVQHLDVINCISQMFVHMQTHQIILSVVAVCIGLAKGISSLFLRIAFSRPPLYSISGSYRE